jgi:tripartite-type tricarboxylate transporter receptor subunit TctC
MRMPIKFIPGLAAVVLALSVQPVSAQGVTGKTVRIVVPFPPGGSADILARLLGQQMTQGSNQAVLIENRPGAGTVIASEFVSRAAPDGTTLLLNANSFVINPHLRPNLSYDPLTSFEPVCLLVTSPQVIVVNSSSPFRTLAELLSAAKSKPGELSLATVGPATTQHIAGEQFKRVARINLTYVPYTGGAPAVNALLGGHVTTVLANYSEVVEQIKAGKLRALAATSRERIEPLPDVPTLVESGYDVDATVWFGLVAPARTPNEVILQLAGMLKAALQAPDVKSKLVIQGLYPVGACGAEYGAHIRKQYDIYGRIIREANIKGE